MQLKTVFRSIFLLSFANELVNMGLMVWASGQSDNAIGQTALVTVWAAAGYLLALVLAQKSQPNLSTNIILICTAITSILPVFLPELSNGWGVTILLRNAFGQILYARLSTSIPNICTEDMIAEQTKKAQIYGLIGNVSALVICPWMTEHFGLPGILLVSFSFIGLFWFSIKSQTIKSQTEQTETVRVGDIKNALLVPTTLILLFVLFATWALYGTFFVIEIPLIRARIGEASWFISAILCLNLIGNLAGVKIIPTKYVTKNPTLTFLVSTVILAAMVFCYFRSYHIFSIVIAVLCIGLANGIMNYAVFLVAQSGITNHIREALYLSFKLTIELGILTGIAIVYLIRNSEALIYSHLGKLAISVMMIQGFALIYHKYCLNSKWRTK